MTHVRFTNILNSDCILMYSGQRGRTHWAGYYTSLPKSCNNVLLFVGFIALGTFDWIWICLFIKLSVQTFYPLLVDLYQFIDHCLISLYPCKAVLHITINLSVDLGGFFRGYKYIKCTNWRLWTHQVIVCVFIFIRKYFT